MLNVLRDVFTPNKKLARRTKLTIILVQVLLLLGLWILFPPVMIPKLPQVLAAFGTLWKEGIVAELMTSFVVNLKALALTVGISLMLSYLTVVPAVQPVTEAVAKMRFLGLTGLTLPFTLMFGGGEPLKIAILTFGMVVYFVTTMADEVACIPRESFDHARTLRMKEWQVVWETVVRAKLDRAFEVMRQIAAIGWMMLTMVEGMVRSQGGVGTVLLNMNKQLDKLPEVFAILVIIIATGILQDSGIRLLQRIVCPWANLTMERR
jgi:NitT/TauT family transport system permease protein